MTIFDLWILLIACGLAIGLNPNLISVYTVLASATFGKGGKKSNATINTLIFVMSLLLFYLAFLIIVAAALSSLSITSLSYAGLIIALIMIFSGLYNIALAFEIDTDSLGRKFIPSSTYKRIIKKVGLINSAYFALTTAIKSPQSTLMPLTGVALILAITNSANNVHLIMFPLALMIPIIIVAFLSIFKLKISVIMKWKNDNTSTFLAWSGVLIIVMAWFILLLVNRSIWVEL
jgi:hypothetical protein